MTTKKALTISLLAIALTGLTAGIITYSKKTGKNPFKTQETKAYTVPSNITSTNNEISSIQLIGGENGSRIELTLTNVAEGTNITGNIKLFSIEGITLRNLYQTPIAETLLNYNITDIYELYLEHSTITITKQTTPATKTFLNTVIKLKAYVEEDADEDETIFTLFQNTFQIANTYEIATYPQNVIQTIYVQTTVNNIQTYGTTQYQAGAGAATDAGNTGVIDIRGLMLQVLTMPFTFISQAFDVTFWEGTQYEFHLAGFIKGLIAIASILFIIRLFTSGFSIMGNFINGHTERNLKRSQTKLNKAKTRRESNLADKGK